MRSGVTNLLASIRWMAQVVRLRVRLLAIWLRRWVEAERLERRRRTLFSRFGEAVYRGDAPAADASRAELDEVDRRLGERRRELESEIAETLRREQEAALASRRTAVIRQAVPEPEEHLEEAPTSERAAGARARGAGQSAGRKRSGAPSRRRSR